MAVVRITDRLMSEVDYEIRRQFTNRSSPLESTYQNVLSGTPDFTNALEATICDRFNVTLAQVHAAKPFVQHTSSLTITSLNSVPIRSRFSRVTLSRAIPWPTTMTITSFDSPRLAPWATKLQRLNSELEELDGEERVFRDQVRTLLRSCTTYRQALEAWPQLTAVTPKEFLERHERQAVREKVEPSIPKLDTETLNLTAVKNTIAKASLGGKD